MCFRVAPGSAANSLDVRCVVRSGMTPPPSQVCGVLFRELLHLWGVVGSPCNGESLAFGVLLRLMCWGIPLWAVCIEGVI